MHCEDGGHEGVGDMLYVPQGCVAAHGDDVEARLGHVGFRSLQGVQICVGGAC